jgi:2-dehydro-3-deoxy-L-rhamnonate dehydrogenase (NAD+)
MVYSGRFEGRTAVVTGAASGIGHDVARRLAAEGARVSMWDLNASALATAAVEVGAAHTQSVDIARRKKPSIRPCGGASTIWAAG